MYLPTKLKCVDNIVTERGRKKKDNFFEKIEEEKKKGQKGISLKLSLSISISKMN